MKIIISNTDVGALTKAADAVLKRYNNDVHNIPENVKGQAVLSVLKNMTQNKRYFDVTAVNELAKMNEVEISPEHMEFFSAMHCIHWNEMHEDTREYFGAIQRPVNRILGARILRKSSNLPATVISKCLNLKLPIEAFS